MLIRFGIVGIVTAITLFGNICRAETLVPKSFEYEFDFKEDVGAGVCQITLLLLNIPAPEAINFHF